MKKIEVLSEELGLPEGRLFEVKYRVMYSREEGWSLENFTAWEVMEDDVTRSTVSWEMEEKISQMLLKRYDEGEL